MAGNSLAADRFNRRDRSAARAEASAAGAAFVTSNGFNPGMHLRQKTAALATTMQAIEASGNNNRLKSEGKSER
ncbi:hypothetical protein FHT77_004488 [Rhizobium sp. BK181]|uniref:hypothetical protein n=1 Tax=Rhizobium sp. BK181 TaxID=2587072 RepID=UPI001847C1DD|nr:hypothetical protein [Rhizobium sp. BK181]MBB3318587.1 hypothetical protein [Rhizobium sp. BK181]